VLLNIITEPAPVWWVLGPSVTTIGNDNACNEDELFQYLESVLENGAVDRVIPGVWPTIWIVAVDQDGPLVRSALNSFEP
jgi:hypothetical protein